MLNAVNVGHSRGVETQYILNSLNYFHVCAPGLPPCIGHDLSEGVVDIDLFLYINHMVCILEWFSYEYIHWRFMQFRYVGDAAADPPVPLNPECTFGWACRSELVHATNAITASW